MQFNFTILVAAYMPVMARKAAKKRDARVLALTVPFIYVHIPDKIPVRCVFTKRS